MPFQQVLMSPLQKAKHWNAVLVTRETTQCSRNCFHQSRCSRFNFASNHTMSNVSRAYLTLPVTYIGRVFRDYTPSNLHRTRLHGCRWLAFDKLVATTIPSEAWPGRGTAEITPPVAVDNLEAASHDPTTVPRPTSATRSS